MKIKGILVGSGVDCSLVVIWYKKFVSWKVWRLTSWNLVQGEIVGNIILNISRLIYYCNIRLPYRIRKIVGNIPINILGHEEKKLWDGDELVKTIRDE